MDFTSAMNLFGAVVVSLGGSTAIVFGLSSWIGKIWANRLMEKDKLKYTKEIETLKNELQTKITQMEHFHQISQETYQKLFTKKIEIYESLINEKIEYLKTTHEDEMFELHDYPEVVYYNFFVKIRNILDKNRMYISNELSNKYDALYYKIAPLLKKLGLDEVYAEMNNTDSTAFKDITYSEMVSKTSEELDALLQQIDDDVRFIRAKVDLTT